MSTIWRGLRSVFTGNATRVEKGAQSSSPGGYSSSAAVNVTEDVALQVSAVWGCSRLISEVFACLPMSMYERKGGVTSVVRSHTLSYILTESPNSRMTAFEFYECMQLNLALHGNAYARIARNARGDVVALWPLPAQSVTPHLGDDGKVVYHWFHDRDVSVISDDNILHLRLFGNGLVGLSPLAYSRNAVGLASANDNHSTKIIQQHGGKPSGVLYTDSDLTKAQRESARANFKEIVEESEDSRRLLVLPLGFKYNQVQMSNADLELLSSRKYQLEEICRFMGNIPPILICATEGSTTLGSSVEQILLGWYRLGLNPYAERWEQALAKKLLSPEDRRKYAFHIDFRALTRGDSKARMEYVKGMVGGPVQTPNEGRAEFGLPPVEGGDRLNPAPTEARVETKKEVKKDA